MDLILWRHAEAEPGRPDLVRPLTAKGVEQAARIGAWLHAHLPDDTRVLVSPAQRALQTARALPRPAHTDPVLAPGGTVAALLSTAGWPDARQPVLVVGHQPTLGGVASFLIAGEEDFWTVNPGGVWWLTNRDRGGDTAVQLRLVLSPELVDPGGVRAGPE
jgi:phosphohistidine phosphatase